MNADSSLDRESFQQFLANAFVVQESRIDPRFLSAMLKVQRLVTQGELDVEGAMNLIVDSARDVAGAAGVAIGLLQGDQLIYQSGSGCFSAHAGSRVAASLTVSARTRTSREILRVENARTDTRVEGAICRQFGAESLLILPIYGDRTLAGVLVVLFRNAHSYSDSEVGMYRLMAGLIEVAMSPAISSSESSLPAVSPAVRRAFEGTAKSQEYFPEDQPIHDPPLEDRPVEDRSAEGRSKEDRPAEDRPAEDRPAEDRPILSYPSENPIYLRCEAALLAIKRSPAFRRSGVLAEILVQRATKAIANKPIHGLTLSAVIIGLGLTFWITHGNHRPAAPWLSSVPSGSTAVRSVPPDVIPVPGKPTVPSVSVPLKGAARLARPGTRRSRAADADVDYIGDDVTVRHFIYKTARQKTAVRVANIGEDVTVRYFTPKPVVHSNSR